MCGKDLFNYKAIHRRVTSLQQAKFREVSSMHDRVFYASICESCHNSKHSKQRIIYRHTTNVSLSFLNAQHFRL